MHIFSYRDGISEGEYNAVARREYTIIRGTLSDPTIPVDLAQQR